jgi:hypothetical protein
MAKPHGGKVAVRREFADVHQRLTEVEYVELMTAKGRRFTVQADWAQKGPHAGEAVVRLLEKGNEVGRVYACCWGHETNCNASAVGAYCLALDGWE